MVDLNTAVVSRPRLTRIAASQHLAVAVELSDVQRAVVALSADLDFGSGAEPVADGTCYTATDGGVYYRPSFRVADRGPGMLAGPDVWFRKDEQGVIRLEWSVEDAPPSGAPDEAGPLPITVDAVTLTWEGGSRVFEGTALDPVADPVAGGPRLRLHGGCVLDPVAAHELEVAMARADCTLTIDYSYTYVMQVADAPAGPVRRPPIRIPHRRGIDTTVIETPPIIPRIPKYVQPEELKPPVPGPPPELVSPVLLRSEALIATPLLARRVDFAKQTLIELNPQLIGEIGRKRIPDVLADPPATHPDQRRQTASRTVSFFFAPDDDANRLIYRALHDVANLTDEWRLSDAGYLRASGFPNTVYRIPDEMRLAYDPDLAGPHVVPTLHTGDDGTSSVRVLLRVAPWQDPRQIQQVRKLVRSEAADVIVGRVESASLRLGGSFPDAIKILDGGAAAISLDEGADLLLDLSLEYYQLLCGMLGGPTGLPGTVEVVLSHPAPVEGGDAPPPTTVVVQVRLRMDKVDDLPVTVAAPSGYLSPTTTTVVNTSGRRIRIGGAEAVFLQIASNSVVPLGAYEARCATAFPLELDPGQSVELAFELAQPGAEGIAWNAVLVDLLDKTMTDDASTVLKRANEVAGAGELSWDLTVQSPVLAATPPPAKWASLLGLEVEVSAPGFDTTVVVLNRAAPAKKVTMRMPLAALVSGGAAGIQTVSYRVRNDYDDHQGAWTDPQQQSGEELVVYPNQAAGD